MRVASLKQTLDNQTSGANILRNASGIRSFEALLQEDPQFKSDVRQLALQNPAAMERIVPQILRSPDDMKTLVANTLSANAPKPAAAAQQPAAQQPAAPSRPAAAAAPARPKPTIESAGGAPSRPEPVAAAAATAGAAKPETPAASAAPAAPATGGNLLDEMADKMEQLAQIPGYNDLLDRVEGNPHLDDMFKTMLDPSKDVEGGSKMLDEILERAGSTPEERAQSTIFTDLVKTIDEKPGMVSSLASNFANDPKTGMMMIGMYSQFSQGFGKFIDDLFGPGFLDGMLGTLMDYVGKLLGQSGGLMNMSNNGGGLLKGVMGALGVKDDAQISDVSPENGTVTTQTAEAYRADGSPVAQAPGQNPQGINPPDPNERNPNQAPQGPAPAMS